MSEDDEYPVVPYSEAKRSGNPQRRFVEALPTRRLRYKFVPRKGQVLVEDEDDMSEAMQYDLNEAIMDSEEESKRRRSYANVGYPRLKQRGS